MSKRVKLVKMNDPRPIPLGTEGDVIRIDAIGQIHVKWDNGRVLAIVPGEDEFIYI